MLKALSISNAYKKNLDKSKMISLSFISKAYIFANFKTKLFKLIPNLSFVLNIVTIYYSNFIYFLATVDTTHGFTLSLHLGSLSDLKI